MITFPFFGGGFGLHFDHFSFLFGGFGLHIFPSNIQDWLDMLSEIDGGHFGKAYVNIFNEIEIVPNQN